MRFADSVFCVDEKPPLKTVAPEFHLPEKAISIRKAALSRQETVDVEESEGRILAVPTVGCPPAVPKGFSKGFQNGFQEVFS